MWGAGNHQWGHGMMGAHDESVGGWRGTRCVVWAASERRVSVVGCFNNWDGWIHGMRKYHDEGIWEIFIPHVTKGDYYKFEIQSQPGVYPIKKSDPYAFFAE